MEKVGSWKIDIMLEPKRSVGQNKTGREETYIYFTANKIAFATFQELWKVIDLALYLSYSKIRSILFKKGLWARINIRNAKFRLSTEKNAQKWCQNFRKKTFGKNLFFLRENHQWIILQIQSLRDTTTWYALTSQLYHSNGKTCWKKGDVLGYIKLSREKEIVFFDRNINSVKKAN